LNYVKILRHTLHGVNGPNTLSGSRTRMLLTYLVDNKKLRFKAPDKREFSYGENVVLSELYEDIVLDLPWSQVGHSEFKLFTKSEFSNLKESLTLLVRKIIIDLYPRKSLDGFTLEKYHRYVDISEHELIINKTRRIYPSDLSFDTDRVVGAIEENTKSTLSFSNPFSKTSQWLIVRINPPGSKGYNPPHKDIYQILDQGHSVPQMINCWVPICGVNNNTGLPIAGGSHLYRESDISRTKAGVRFEGQDYSVNCVGSWCTRNNLNTVSPEYGKMLLFSSHLIHGLGVNHNRDETRVSFELRMFAA